MSNFIKSFSNKNFLRFWFAQLISQCGDRITQAALVGMVMGRVEGAEATTAGLAKVIAFTIFPVFIVGPVAGAYVDRWDRRTTLFVCDILRAALICLIPFIFIRWESMIPIYIIVFLSFCCSRFHVLAKMSIVPDLVKDEKDLLIANSLVSVTGMIAVVLGFLLGALIVDLFGARAGFFVDSATFFLSGILVFTIRKDVSIKINTKRFIKASQEFLHDVQQSIIDEIKAGFSYLFNHKNIRFIINTLFIIFSAAGAIYVVIMVFVLDTFSIETMGEWQFFGRNLKVTILGILAAILALGLFVGSLIYGRFGQKLNRFKTVFICLTGGGIMLVLFAFLVKHIPNLWLAGALAFVLGVVIGPIFIAANTVVHEVCHDDMRGKVFSGVEIVIHLGFLMAMLLSSFLTRYVSHSSILIAAGGVFALIGIVGLLNFKKKMELLNS